MDEAAFSDYVAARRPQLFRTACLLCGDPHRAEDVVQDALARLYAAWDRVGRMDSVDAYGRRIIVNAHYGDRRRPWRRERASEPRDVPLEPGFPMEDAEAVRAAIRSLPPGHGCGDHRAGHLPVGRVGPPEPDQVRSSRRARYGAVALPSAFAMSAGMPVATT
ncbi:sigma factor [Nocardioides taihuensis]|uniref:Sigma factor n=1 Tax=Nocardioides taihuensis TaxID=1835606 RepID=A0ABW0BHG4_9ACTN